MKRILIYGAGIGGDRLYKEMNANDEDIDLIAYIDRRLCGGYKDGVPIIHPEEIKNYHFDVVYITTLDETVPSVLITEYGISSDKINTQRFLNSTEIAVRIRALECFKRICEEFSIHGSVAEVGVYQGGFARHINRLFPNEKLYLYDTFQGFDERDIELETNKDVVNPYRHYSKTGKDYILSKMIAPQNVIICKGYFPDTAIINDENYAFVSLDADLYEPTLAGLKFFYPKLTRGG